MKNQMQATRSCEKCGRYRKGQSYSFNYSEMISRNPFGLNLERVQLQPLGTQEVFLCNPCAHGKGTIRGVGWSIGALGIVPLLLSFLYSIEIDAIKVILAAAGLFCLVKAILALTLRDPEEGEKAAIELKENWVREKYPGKTIWCLTPLEAKTGRRDRR